MTAFFVKTFKRQNKCPHCKRDKASGYSLCSKHLQLAREKFRLWTVERRGVGRCISCNRKSRKARSFLVSRHTHEVRCEIHAKINRAKVAAWCAAHPNYSHKVWLERKGQYKRCRESGHARLRGQRVCDGCSKRNRTIGLQPSA
jgi:hypothetical protein